MLNYLWAGMMMLGIVYAAFTGRSPTSPMPHWILLRKQSRYALL